MKPFEIDAGFKVFQLDRSSFQVEICNSNEVHGFMFKVGFDLHIKK